MAEYSTTGYFVDFDRMMGRSNNTDVVFEMKIENDVIYYRLVPSDKYSQGWAHLFNEEMPDYVSLYEAYKSWVFEKEVLNGLASG
jgi:hypothetical protein